MVWFIWGEHKFYYLSTFLTDPPGVPEKLLELYEESTWSPSGFVGECKLQVLSAIHSGCSCAMSCRIQARKLLVEPILDTETIGPVVIVIDALDDSGKDDKNTGTNCETLVHAIVHEFSAMIS